MEELRKDAEFEKRENERVYIPVEHRGNLKTALGELVLSRRGCFARAESS